MNLFFILKKSRIFAKTGLGMQKFDVFFSTLPGSNIKKSGGPESVHLWV
jgi:hypothetical protein